jgi:hypothetical protein
MDAVSILSSPTPVTVSDEGEASSGEIKAEAQAIVGGEAPKTESVEAKPAVEPPKDEYISPRFAMLAKEEKRLQEERKRLMEQKKDPEFQEFLEYKKLKSSAKQDPLALMEKFGLTYDELTDYVISGKHTKDPSVRALEEKLEKMEREAKEREENAKKQLQEAQLQQFNEQIKAKCLEKADDFELVNIWGAHNLVYSVIQEHYNKTEEVLPIDEAAKKVEAYLEKESEKYQGSKKLRKLFGVPDLSQAQNKEAETNHQAESEPVRASSMSTTLSNTASSGSTSTDEVDEADPRVLLEKAKRLLQR